MRIHTEPNSAVSRQTPDSVSSKGKAICEEAKDAVPNDDGDWAKFSDPLEYGPFLFLGAMVALHLLVLL